jgi:hypothetical protein
MVTLIEVLSSTDAPVQKMILPDLDVADTIALTPTYIDLHAELPAVLKATAYSINELFRILLPRPAKVQTGTTKVWCSRHWNVLFRVDVTIEQAANRSDGVSDD